MTQVKKGVLQQERAPCEGGLPAGGLGEGRADLGAPAVVLPPLLNLLCPLLSQPHLLCPQSLGPASPLQTSHLLHGA